MGRAVFGFVPGIDAAVFNGPDAISIFQKTQIVGDEKHSTASIACKLAEQFNHILT